MIRAEEVLSWPYAVWRLRLFATRRVMFSVSTSGWLHPVCVTAEVAMMLVSVQRPGIWRRLLVCQTRYRL